MKEQRKTRVLMLLENSYYPHDPRVNREALALRDAGYQVTVICPAYAGDKQPMDEMVDGVRAYRYPPSSRGSGLVGYLWEYGYAMAAALVRSLQLFFTAGFDVIHAANPPDTFAIIAALYKPFGVKFLYDHHDLSPEMYDARSGFQGNRTVYKALMLLEKLSYRVANHVIATNESYKRIAMERGAVPESRITVVRNGPDLKILDRVEPIPELRDSGRHLLGYAGLMGPQDRVDCLLRALHHLVHDVGRTDFRCILMGAGEALPELKALTAELKLEEYVEFTGWLQRSEMARYLHSVEICVAPEPSNPYNDHSTAVKLMEYMAVEKPIVAFDLPEHRFTAGDAALYVRPNDELEYARALAALMDDPERRKTMGSLGRRRVEAELAWPHSVPKLLRAYTTMLAEAEQPGDKTSVASIGRQNAEDKPI